MNELLFYVVIFLSNIIQGITGFAGTILAMPPSLMLVGLDVAKPVLNALGLMAGAYVFLLQGRHVNYRELKKVVLIMTVSIVAGILLRSACAGQEKLLYKGLGIFVMVLALQGLSKPRRERKKSRGRSAFVLVLAGIAHGMFVSGGPLLIGYLSGVIKDKLSFRATISTVWMILNTILLIDDIRAALWTAQVVRIQITAVLFFLAGMAIGSRICARMSGPGFMRLTYILLMISGASLWLA